MNFNETKIKLDKIGCGFCLAKWTQVTMHLHNGMTHSCHHPAPHKISLEELERNPTALHNSKVKKQARKEMLEGKRPSECQYCWNIEDNSTSFSDRIFKSSEPWSEPHLKEITNLHWREDYIPKYVEVSFSNVCNFKCAYCSPDLSSQWHEEISKHGAYPTSRNYNGFDWFKQVGKMPIKHSDPNPYVDAFWAWWPELYKNLHTLRLTGGEPLLSKDVWRMLDAIEADPKQDLVLAINTNLGVSRDIIDRMITKINNISKNIQEVQIFTSGEAMGKAGEYIRYGLDYQEWCQNLEYVLDNTNCIVAVMTTVNLTSITTYCDFVRYLLDLRGRYNKTVTFNKVQFMTNTLRYPEFLSLTLLDKETKINFAQEVETLIAERGKFDGLSTLSVSEVDQLRRMINYMNEITPNEKTLRKDFVAFINEYDQRRNTDFNQVFPELTEFYKICQQL